MDEYYEFKVENDYFYGFYDDIMAEYDDEKSLDENFSHICTMLNKNEDSKYLQSCIALAMMKAYRDFGGQVVITNDQIERIKQLDREGLIELEADEICLSKRYEYLDKYFTKIVKPPCKNPKAKRKVKLDFKKGDCIYHIYDGKYIIGVVLEENYRTREILVALFIEKSLLPIEKILEMEPIIVAWGEADLHLCEPFKEYYIWRDIKIWNKLKVEKNNKRCGQGIFFNYFYFDSNVLDFVKENTQYDGFSVYIDHTDNKRECSVHKEKPCWGWKHITAPDYKYLKDYIK